MWFSKMVQVKCGHPIHHQIITPSCPPNVLAVSGTLRGVVLNQKGVRQPVRTLLAAGALILRCTSHTLSIFHRPLDKSFGPSDNTKTVFCSYSAILKTKMSKRFRIKGNVNPTYPSKRQCSNTKRVFGCHISILIVKIVKQCFIKLPMTPGKIQVLNIALAVNRHVKYLCNPCHNVSPLTPQQCKLR